MTTTQKRVESYFHHVVIEYNCGDIRALIDKELPQAGPLLACVVNGIDLMGGMMLGFHEGSRKRSVEFMKHHLSMDEESAELLYRVVRCGIAHEGVPKLAMQFFVYYERIKAGTFLFRGDENCIWLNVTELARVYLDAVSRINGDVKSHLHHTPDPNMQDEAAFLGTIDKLTANIDEFCGEIADGQALPESSESPFFAEWLEKFSVNTSE